MLFAGTAISNGSCIGIVNDIGMSTEIGKIQRQIQEAADEEEDTPLKKKLDKFGERLAQAILAHPTSSMWHGPSACGSITFEYRTERKMHSYVMSTSAEHKSVSPV